MTDTEIKIIIGNQIKEARKIKKISQSELAEMVGVKSLSILKYEKGERDIPFSLLVKICEALDITLEDFELFFIRRIDFYHTFVSNILTNNKTKEIFNNSNYKQILALLEFLKSSRYFIEFNIEENILNDLRLFNSNSKIIFPFDTLGDFASFLDFFAVIFQEMLENYLNTHTEKYKWTSSINHEENI